MGQIRIYGVKINDTTLQRAVEEALTETGEPCVVFTPNAIMLEQCRRDDTLRDLLNHASLSLPDGAGVLLAAKKQGAPLDARVAGIDFGEGLIAAAEARGLRVFLLGGGEGVADAAARELQKKHPRLCICGTTWGYFDRNGAENVRVISHIRACRPHILFVCLGFPLQERWIVDNLHLLEDIQVIAGLGGSLDVWSGRLRRAPALLSGMGLEWAWRMMRQPRRMVALPQMVSFLWHVPRNAAINPQKES
jgi:N-acetylglucosaminyldiphosphoundecaprenol N-acetyl-beta-D-mannosaminyltransferase